MRILLNGLPREVGEGLTLGQLFAELGLSSLGFAVAVNSEVVPRGQQERRQLVEGDRVELVRAVGGG